MESVKRKKKSQDGPAGGSGFAVMFTSLSIIMLAFFILLNSMAVVDQSRKLAALGSLLGSFKILPGGKRVSKGNILTLSGSPFVTEKAMMALERLDIFRKTNLLGEQLRWYVRDYGVVVSLAESILFEPNRVDVSPRARELLEHVGQVIRHFPKRVQVEGHTDDSPLPPGPYSTHWELSGMQAVNVVRYLVEQGGLEPQRFSALGFGSLWPVAPNNSQDNRMLNRRVEIVLIGNFQALHPKVIDVGGFRFPVKEIWRW